MKDAGNIEQTRGKGQIKEEAQQVLLLDVDRFEKAK